MLMVKRRWDQPRNLLLRALHAVFEPSVMVERGWNIESILINLDKEKALDAMYQVIDMTLEDDTEVLLRNYGSKLVVHVVLIILTVYGI